MKLNYFAQRLSTIGRWLMNATLCLMAIALIWQGALPTPSAMASSSPTLIAAADDAIDQANDKYQREAGRSKNFIEDTKEKVQQAAKDNAGRVDRATDDDNPIAGKAKRDAARVQKRAEEDADRTQNAVDSARNAVERTVDSIKGAFGD